MLKKIIQYLLAWRFLTLAIAALAVFFLPAKDCCREFGSQLSFSYLSHVWANFAGQDFLDLARFGYGYPLKISTYIFFPLFPGVIRALSHLIPDYLSSALVISHICLILALFFLYKLVRLDYQGKIATKTLIILVLFPSAFFFGSVYSESFFLLLVVLSFYLVRKHYFFLACLIGLLASATRVAGIFLWPALIWEIWQSKRFTPSFAWLTLPPLGLLAYMKFLAIKTGDPFFFLKVSPDFGPNLVITKLILVHQVFFRYAKMLFLTKSPDVTFLVIFLELITGALFLGLTLISFKKLRLSYALYMFLSYLIPALTGTFAGLPRYALTMFPGFILLALWLSKQKPVVQKVYFSLNVVFGIIVIALFTRGYFVG